MYPVKCSVYTNIDMFTTQNHNNCKCRYIVYKYTRTCSDQIVSYHSFVGSHKGCPGSDIENIE